MIFSDLCAVGRRGDMSNPGSGGGVSRAADDESDAPDLNLGKPDAAQGKGEYGRARTAVVARSCNCVWVSQRDEASKLIYGPNWNWGILAP